MIQSFLKDKLKVLLPDLTWTVDYRTANDNTGTVYYEGGGQASLYDVPIRYPRYQVYISSSDFEYAEYAAQTVFKTLHKLTDEKTEVLFYKDGSVIAKKSYHVFFIAAASEPIPLGGINDVMDYSINFDVTLKELKED